MSKADMRSTHGNEWRRFTRGLILGWAVALSAQPAAGANAPAQGARSESAFETIQGLASRAGIEVTVLGKTPDMGEGAAAVDAELALQILRRRSKHRIEVYAPNGRLQQIVMVSPGDTARVAFRPSAERSPRQTTDSSALSVREALRIAQDRSAPYADRQRAIAVLAHSDSRTAVDVLKEIAQREPGFNRIALAALGGLAGTRAAEAAENALGEIDAGDPLDKVRAQAAHDASVLIEALHSGLHTLDRIKLVHSASHAEQGSTLTDFFLEALGDSSASVRVAAAQAVVRAGDGRVDTRAADALAWMIGHDPTARGREAAAVSHRLFVARAGFELGPAAAEVTPADIAAANEGNPDLDSGSERPGGSGRGDDNPVLPGRGGDPTPVLPGSGDGNSVPPDSGDPPPPGP